MAKCLVIMVDPLTLLNFSEAKVEECIIGRQLDEI